MRHNGELRRVTATMQARPWLRRGCQLALVAAVGLAGGAASANPSDQHPDRISDWAIDNEHPENSVPTQEMIKKDPLEMAYWLMDLTAKAQAAVKRGDHAAAVRYFGAMAKAVPDRAVSYSKLCTEYRALGDMPNALLNCAAAISVPGAQPDDYTQYIGLVLAKPGKVLGDKDVAALNIAVKRLRSMPQAADFVNENECAVGVRTDNVDMLAECAPALVAKTPDDPLTLMAQWSLARHQADTATLRAIIDRAKAAHLPPDQITRLEEELAATGPAEMRKAVLGAVLIACLVAALGSLLVLLRGRNRLPTDADLAGAKKPAAAVESAPVAADHANGVDPALRTEPSKEDAPEHDVTSNAP
jgi:hypothetical protein